MLADDVLTHVRAGFSGLYVETYEPDEAQAEIGGLCVRQDWNFITWDIDRGLQYNNQSIEPDGNDPDPLSVIKTSLDHATDDDEKRSVIILRNYHRYINSPEIVQCFYNRLATAKARGIVFVVLSPVIDLPCEISRSFVILRHALPNRKQLEEIARRIGTDEDLPDDLDTLLEASAGLTQTEAENTYSLSIVKHGKIHPTEVWALKAQSLEKTGLMRLHQGSERFSDLGGLDNLKNFCIAALRPNPDRKARPRGVLLLGVPGTGKSALARALGNEVGLPTITLDIGALMGSLVGETERKTREAIATIDAMGKCVVFIDEVEKALSGASNQGGDSGTSARQFGALLTWLSDPSKQAFVICTSNDVSRLPKEFLRSGRFNGIFFFDLPTREQKDKIWSIYLKRFGISDDPASVSDSEWTGAEIEACCETADLLGASLTDASSYIVPVAKTASEQVNALRDWASGRCLSADHAGVYQRNPAQAAPASPTPSRRIQRD